MTGAPGWREGGTVGVVVHPRREIDAALATVRDWAAANGGTVAQVAVDGQGRRVADVADVEACDLLVGLGGDGTVLAALHAAEHCGRPVLGIACGSLGAMTAVRAEDARDALDRFAAGDWSQRRLPGLLVSRDGEALGTAFNDLVVVRGGAGQVILDIEVDDAPYAKVAGDGCVVATPLGSSAYTLAAGGPLLAAAADVIVVTPLAPHGGSIPSVVLEASGSVRIGVAGGWSGARIELDGQALEGLEPPGLKAPFLLDVAVETQQAVLVDLDGETLIAGLRRRGVITDSPRVAVRDERERPQPTRPEVD